MPEIHKILKKYWNFDEFRPLQEDIIQSALEKKDSLVLMPTGGGKSLCYQVPALSQKGLGLVITPLIALMKDQVINLIKRGVDAEAIYSGMHYREIERVLDKCAYGNVKFLYISPERIHTTLFRERLKNITINLIAIDEAHCISQWGFDFRPAYLQIAHLREMLPGVPMMALTATATAQVRKDIVGKLELQEPKHFQKSFERKNLSYSVLYEEDKYGKLTDILQKVPGTSVIYVRSRKRTESVAQFLKEKDFSADFYHGGLSTDIRSEKQKSWMENRTRIMVCTNAFGMGIDKPEVRTVIHLGLPESLEEYYQEAGRAGRDGHKAYGILLFQAQDSSDLRFRFEHNTPNIKGLKHLYHAVGNFLKIAIGAAQGQSFDFDIMNFSKTYQLRPAYVLNGLQQLAQEGFISLSDGVLISSRVWIHTNRKDLYNFQVQNLKYNVLIRSLLRNYEGIMEDHVRISENLLGKVMARPIKEVIEMMKQLHQYEILKYRPQSDKPQINFLFPRFSPENMRLDTERFLFRYQLRKNKIEAMIKYAENKRKCRSRVLLEYFDESNTHKCGICDICLKRNESSLHKNEAKSISEILETQLTTGEKSIEELTMENPQIKKEQLVQVIRELMDAGSIVITAEQKLKLVF